MSLKIQNIIPQIQAEFAGNNNTALIDTVSIDSRSLQNGSQTLFFALVGTNNDAHIYIKDLIEKGVQNFVVTHIPEGCETKANFLIVENTLVALQQFAGYYRSLFDFPIIGLTGSNGKTIVKEWLNRKLSHSFTIVLPLLPVNPIIGKSKRLR